MIYFIASESGQVKIGYSDNNVEGRLMSLQTASPFKLSILKTINGDHIQEKLIHKKFRKYRIRGEWFNICTEILNYIENPYIIENPQQAQLLPDSPVSKFIKACGSKKAAADKLEITVRYVDMILAGKQPSKRLVKLINIYNAS